MEIFLCKKYPCLRTCKYSYMYIVPVSMLVYVYQQSEKRLGLLCPKVVNSVTNSGCQQEFWFQLSWVEVGQVTTFWMLRDKGKKIK